MDNEPTPRVRAALEELAAALHEQYAGSEDDEVAGYGANLTIGPRRSEPTRIPVPVGTAFCLFRGTDSCGLYTDEGEGAPDSCTVYIW